MTAQFGRPPRAAPATAVVGYTVEGVPVEAREIVQRREAQLPYGYEMRELRVVPAIALTVSPRTAVVPVRRPEQAVSSSRWTS